MMDVMFYEAFEEEDREILEKFDEEKFGMRKYVHFDISVNSTPLKETAKLTALYWKEKKEEEEEEKNGERKFFFSS